jgi:hypothetical protein
MRNISDSSCRENQTHIVYSKLYFENRAVYEIMCKNIVKLDGPQMVRVHISGWIPKATDIHSEYLILIAFPRTALEAGRSRV